VTGQKTRDVPSPRTPLPLPPRVPTFLWEKQRTGSRAAALVRIIVLLSRQVQRRSRYSRMRLGSNGPSANRERGPRRYRNEGQVPIAGRHNGSEIFRKRVGGNFKAREGEGEARRLICNYRTNSSRKQRTWRGASRREQALKTRPRESAAPSSLRIFLPVPLSSHFRDTSISSAFHHAIGRSIGPRENA